VTLLKHKLMMIHPSILVLFHSSNNVVWCPQNMAFVW